MICKKCKNEIDNDSRFCVFCCARVENINSKARPKIKEIIFDKKALYFWLFIIATILIIISRFNDYDSFGLWGKGDIFILIKFYIFCVSIYFAPLKFRDWGMNIAFPFIVVGIMLNPFIPLRFNEEETTIFIDLILVTFFGYFSYEEYKKLKENFKKY